MRGELITTATDVYLLGVLLYELLTGRKPFEMRQARLSEMEEIICSQTPPLPSAVMNPRGASPIEIPRIESAADARGTTPQRLRREIAGDLDNIVMKALRKEPERRYTSADELAADLRRFEVGQPVIARRDTWRYRTSKFVRRHSMVVAASAAAVVVLAGVATAMTLQAHRVSQERAVAEQERLRAEETAKFLAGLFEVADPTEAQGRDITAREILERGALRIQQELKDAPETQANLMETIGRVYLSLGLNAEARPQLEKARVMREELLPARQSCQGIQSQRARQAGTGCRPARPGREALPERARDERAPARPARRRRRGIARRARPVPQGAGRLQRRGDESAGKPCSVHRARWPDAPRACRR